MSQLHRSLHDRKVAGVCAGLAETWGFEPIKVRIATVVLSLLAVSAIFMLVMYLVLWWLLPVLDKDGNPPTGTGPDSF